jgi:acetylornithine deacetylase ArgE
MGDPLMDLVGLAKSMIDQDTTNPPGNEGRCARVIRDYVADLHMEDASVELHEYQPGRANLIVKVGPDVPGLVLSGHIDVVPAGDLAKWKSGPFDAEVRDGRLYGRGAVDMKTAVAAMIGAVQATKGTRLKRKLVLAATAGEEINCDGLTALVKDGKLTGNDAMYSIIGEPSQLEPVRAHRGVSTFILKFSGRNAHASRPELGANAVEACARVIVGIESWRKRFEKERDADLGITIVSNTVVRGGTKSNIIPDSCELAIDSRRVAAHTHEEIQDEVMKIANEVTRDQNEIEVTISTVVRTPPLQIPRDHPLVKLAEDVSGREATIATYGTEGPYYADAGIPAVILGPGDIGVAHTPNEYIEVREAERALSVYSELIRRVCS